ncbi:lytic transglycosylase [Rubrivivax gelatinosus]|nr:lytic transglycosylase [Rubrivivax gelatinosus]
MFGRSRTTAAAYDAATVSRLRRFPVYLRPVVLAALLAGAGGARAELWGFVDAYGVAHFAPRAVDSRYRLVHADLAASGPRVPGKRDGADALLTWMEIAPEAKAIVPWVREAARTHGVDAELLTAVIAVESGFRREAVSPRGAIGLMQITADTGDRYGTAAERRRPAAERLLDARTNILTGARMLADLTRRYGHIELALAAWNAGEGTVRRHGGLPRLAETRAHVHLVLELYWALLQRSQTQRATRLALG